jgi:hypothetical protein
MIDGTNEVEAHPAMQLVFEASQTIPASSAALFKRRFGDDPPSIPQHVSALVRRGDTAVGTLCYIHFSTFGTALLGGGACVDTGVLRRLTPDLRLQVRGAGGAYAMTLNWAVAHFQPSVDAVFGHCGDRLAERIDLACGFEKTPHAHLLVFWCKAGDPLERSSLVDRVAAIGPF